VNGPDAPEAVTPVVGTVRLEGAEAALELPPCSTAALSLTL
jgi:hypothetical protein